MEKLSSESIQGTKVRLQPISLQDIERIRNWRNQDRIRQFFIYSDRILPEQQLQWWNSYNKRQNDLMYVIEAVELEKAVGAVALYDIADGRGTFGRLMIGEQEALGSGYALDAVKTLTSFGLNELNLKRITLEVMRNNEKACLLYKRSGYKIVKASERIIEMICEKEA